MSGNVAIALDDTAASEEKNTVYIKTLQEVQSTVMYPMNSRRHGRERLERICMPRKSEIPAS